MKKLLSLVAIAALCAFAADKFVTIKFSEPQINYHWQNLEAIKQVADQSQLPHQQVKFIVSSIDSLQKDIARSAKIDSTSKK